MKRLFASLWRGRALRHLPIALPESEQSLVRLELHGLSATPRDVSHSHVPVSMRPLILGVRIGGPPCEDHTASQSKVSLVA